MMKVAQSINHDGVQYNYGDDISAADAKNLPEGYVVSDGEFDKLEEEGGDAATDFNVDASELTPEQLANHPSQAPSAPPAEPVVEDGALVSPQPEVKAEAPKATPADKK
jgi:hypothetical protein